VERRTRALKEASLEAIFRLTKAAEYKDQDTGLYIQRMSHYGQLLARRLEMDGEWVETFFLATSMHDVGKIGIPDKILLKPGKLNPHEWEVMQLDTVIGGKILEELIV
jgi:putative two-component system response regulator